MLVGKQLGFSAEDSSQPANLNDADRTKLLDYTFAFVASNPDKYEPRQVEIAKRHVEAWGTNTPLNDEGFDWQLLSSEIGNNIGEAVEDISGIGKGVLNLASMGKWLIPTVGIVLAGIIVYKFYRAGAILPSLK